MFTKQNKRKLFLFSAIVFVLVFGFFNFYTNFIQASGSGTGSVSVTIPSGFTGGSVSVTVSGSGGAVPDSTNPTTFTLVPAGTPIPGACGPAAATYSPNVTVSLIGSPCSAGTPSPSNPSLPPVGGSSSWTCNGSSGTTPASCTATRPAAGVPLGVISATPDTCVLPCTSNTPVISWSTSDSVAIAEVYVFGGTWKVGKSGSVTVPPAWISTNPIVFLLYDFSSGHQGGLLSSTTVTGTNTPVSCTNGTTKACPVSNSCNTLTNHGNQTCVNGSWGACDAAAPSEASCSGVAAQCGNGRNAVGDFPNLGNLCDLGTPSATTPNGSGYDTHDSWTCTTPANTASCSDYSCNTYPGGPSADPSDCGTTPPPPTCNPTCNPVSTVLPPSNLSLSCSAPYTGVHASWNPPAGYNTFYFRANPGANNSTSPYATEQNIDPGTSYNFSAGSGQTYYVLVNTKDPLTGNLSNGIYGNVTCGSPVSVVITGTSTCPTGGTPTAPCIFTGEKSTLTWSSTNATSCTDSNIPGFPNTTSGSIDVKPGSTFQYSITCTGANSATGTGAATVTVKHKPTIIEN